MKNVARARYDHVLCVRFDGDFQIEIISIINSVLDLGSSEKRRGEVKSCRLSERLLSRRMNNEGIVAGFYG